MPRGGNPLSIAAASELQLAEAARIMREAMKSQRYRQDTTLGPFIGDYMRARRKALAENTLMAYESTLHRMAVDHADVPLADFEPRGGTQLLEEWLDLRWGEATPATYNRHLATLKDFFKFLVIRGAMQGDPTLMIEKAKRRETYRTTFGEDHVRRIIAEQESLRDRIALRLLLHYGLRRGGLRAIQFKHFDHVRKRLTVFLKGGKVRQVPIPEPAFWHDLERHILDAEAQPNHYLLTARFANRYGAKDKPEQAMSAHGLHKWWYRCLANAGIVPEGTTAGEHMHKARHTAGQAVLDKTGNLKAVQELLGHASIQTTGDIYTDWNIDALTVTMRHVYADDDD